MPPSNQPFRPGRVWGGIWLNVAYRWALDTGNQNQYLLNISMELVASLNGLKELGWFICYCSDQVMEWSSGSGTMIQWWWYYDPVVVVVL